MPKDGFLEIYPQMMEELSQGFALYKPWVSNSLRPGMCGYFDEEGDWNLIVDLATIPESKGEYTQLEGGLDTQQTPKEDWGPVCSEGATFASARQDISANVPGVPVSVGVKLEFTSTRSQSAALIVAPVEKSFLVGDTRFHNWCKANAAVIMKKFGDEVKKYGLWIVRKTSTTARCSVAVWKGINQKVSMGVSLDAIPFGKFNGGGEWGQFAKVGNWRDFPSTEETPQNFVIFIGGLKYKFNALSAFFGGPPLTSLMPGRKGFAGEEEPMGDFSVTTTYNATVQDWDVEDGPPPLFLQKNESETEQSHDLDNPDEEEN